MAESALHRIGAMLEGGDAAGALAAATRALDARDVEPGTRASLLWLRARAADACRQWREAIADLELLARMVPSDPRVWSELGVMRTKVGEPALALQAFARVAQLAPERPSAWNNLGNALNVSGRRDEAQRAFERAIGLDPNYAMAFASLGTLLRGMGHDPAATKALERALVLDPKLATAWSTLASIRQDRGDMASAVQMFERAATLAPRDPGPCNMLGRALAETDALDAARTAYQQAVARDARFLRGYAGRELALPNVYADNADVAASRQRYADGLGVLEREWPRAAAGMPHEQRLDNLLWSNFLLGYQGQDDCALQQRYGALLASLLAAPATVVEPAAALDGRRIRVGFLSAFFRDSTVGSYFQSWITSLDRARFETFVYHLNTTNDHLAQTLRATVDHFRDCPRWKPSALERTVRADGLDALIFPEMGMDATTFVLGAMRLAPLQCAGWGHPVTTGLAAIDLFFSSAAMEPEGADAHYSERLVRLPGIGTRYSLPAAGAMLTRVEAGLPLDGPLFLCPQSLFKILPDDDALLAATLAAMPEAGIVFFAGRNSVVSARFLVRFRAALAAEGIDERPGQVTLLPVMPRERYLGVNALCTAMLDTTHWSGGNTTLDAIASGLPVVTMPGPFMRARQTAGMYALMGIDTLTVATPAAYVALATRIVRDPAFRAAQVAALASRRVRIFDDEAPVQALAAAIEAGVRANATAR